MAKEHCKVQLHLRGAEETHDGFSLLPDRCIKILVIVRAIFWPILGKTLVLSE